ncbi:hypothetical protein ABEB36_008689 [Hypothenemus hampei]|uniref:G-protein coupled receptors family 1 profile domain-containing protein n=1 Tax=Hypothenemus hampei TaxID=57062 RepID=A0ABD1EMT8_HYPHA
MSVNHSTEYSHAHHEVHEGDPTRTFKLTTFFISIPICLVAIVVDLLLIFFILKYRAFKTRGNYYIVNFCICNIVFLATEHVVHLAMDLFFGGQIQSEWYCTFIQLENYFLDMCIVFVAGYAVDEYIVMISSDYFLYMYKNGFKYIIGSIYLLHIVLAFIVSSVCFSSPRDIKFHISFIFVTIIYAICWAIVIKIKIECRKTKFKSNLYLMQAMSVTQFTLLFFLPLLFYYNVISIAERIITDDNLDVLRMLAFISEYLAYAATFALAYKLFKTNKFYRLAICKIFCKNNSNLDFSRLDILPEADIDKN